jgi:hypothetical protein
MPHNSADQAVIDSFDMLVRQIHAENRNLLSRADCVRRAAVRNPKLHRLYIIATNPANRNAAVDLTDWRKQVRSQWRRPK